MAGFLPHLLHRRPDVQRRLVPRGKPSSALAAFPYRLRRRSFPWGFRTPRGPRGGSRGASGSSASPFNTRATVAAFLAWFGGAGYLLSYYYGVWIVLAFGLAVVSGFIGASIVFFFLARVLMRKEEPLNPADYDMVGVLGKVTSGIRPSGTGEMLFSQAGARRAAAARSENGLPIPKGAEVVVTRYERGVAYVRLWEELAKDSDLAKEKNRESI